MSEEVEIKLTLEEVQYITEAMYMSHSDAVDLYNRLLELLPEDER